MDGTYSLLPLVSDRYKRFTLQFCFYSYTHTNTHTPFTATENYKSDFRMMSLEMSYNSTTSQRIFVLYIRNTYAPGCNCASHHMVQLYMCASACLLFQYNQRDVKRKEREKEE